MMDFGEDMLRKVNDLTVLFHHHGIDCSGMKIKLGHAGAGDFASAMKRSDWAAKFVIFGNDEPLPDGVVAVIGGFEIVS